MPIASNLWAFTFPIQLKPNPTDILIQFLHYSQTNIDLNQKLKQTCTKNELNPKPKNNVLMVQGVRFKLTFKFHAKPRGSCHQEGIAPLDRRSIRAKFGFEETPFVHKRFPPHQTFSFFSFWLSFSVVLFLEMGHTITQAVSSWLTQIARRLNQ